MFTLGSAWAELFDESFARQLAGIHHLNVGNPNFKVMPFAKVLQHAVTVQDFETLEKLLERVDLVTTQSSEIVWKLNTLVAMSDIILIDTKMLDTAIGQFLLMCQARGNKPVWAVGVDPLSSPIAPAYIKGTIYPQTPDDLVKLVLQEWSA